jgi:hypothetical protein
MLVVATNLARACSKIAHYPSGVSEAIRDLMRKASLTRAILNLHSSRLCCAKFHVWFPCKSVKDSHDQPQRNP